VRGISLQLFVKKVLEDERILRFVITLQEAFTAVVPYILLTYVIFFAYFLLDYFGIEIRLLSTLSDVLERFLPVAIAASISYFFAVRLKVSQIMAVFLSLAVLLTVWTVEATNQFILPKGATPGVLIVPFISTYFLKKLYPYLSLRLKEEDGNFHIYRLVNYLLVFVGAFAVSLILYLPLSFYINSVESFIRNGSWIEKVPSVLLLAFRDFVIQFFWFFGIHGSHIAFSIFGAEPFLKEIFPGLKAIEFHRMFVNVGGDGLGLPMAIAFLFALRDKPFRTIVRVSFPFTFFNINTLLIYSVIVLNRFFLIPFIFLPLFNLFAAYAFLSIFPVHFTNFTVVWTTPPFLDAYLKTGGNLGVVAFQVLLVCFDSVVYYRFAKKFSEQVFLLSSKKVLEKNLEIGEEIQSQEGILAYKAQREIILAQSRLNELVRSLNAETLRIFYQPKVDVREGSCSKFEALLRFRQGNRWVGPVFLCMIEQAGLAPIVDVWVCKQVKKDIEALEREGLNLEISVNLHPDTIRNKDAIRRVISILEGKNVVFEIVERSFLYGSIAEENVKSLKDAGFKISIDDFGTGYSSFEIITKFDIDEIKLDKSLIDIVDTPRGLAVCKHVTKMCHDIGCDVVAEGVETRKQFMIVKRIGVDYVQGFFFSRAVPFEEMKKLAFKKFEV
jgi:EAL domain-containing protein (putative c-di-GMP-specific phosphodiesterase class I)/cellobiose-specific phosphotransferase system component IIC